jgi:FkbM family methyltransferase
MKVRPNTWDAAIAQAITTDNSYNLPENLEGQVIVDVGAHIGAFAEACRDRGAARIVCFEPDKSNFELLTVNNGGSNTDIYNTAVTGKRSVGLKLRRLQAVDYGNGIHTGRVDVFGYDEQKGFSSISLDEVLELIQTPVDILKLSCQGSEWGIFEHSSFAGVKNIIAELHPITSGDHPSIETYKDKSLSELAQQAVRQLRQKGFLAKVRMRDKGTALLTAAPATAISVARASTKKVLWIGHAGVVSGYGKVTENICTRLYEKGWDVSVYGIGYTGEPHKMPYPIFPEDPTGQKLQGILTRVDPDIVVVLDDHWNVAIQMEMLASMGKFPPVVGYIAVDSENVRRETCAQLRTLKHTIVHTEYGIGELAKAGFTGSYSVAGHGVDSSLYMPYDKADARRKMQISIAGKSVEDAFIWGVVGMNQPRKRIDLSMAFFAAWWKAAGKPDNAYLYLHTNFRGGVWNIPQLAEFLGIKGHVMTTAKEGIPENSMPAMYSIFDCMISTSEGESWGMCNHEGMACGIPQIAVQCGGMADWAKDAMLWVKPSHYAFTPNGMNTKRYIASERDFVDAMQRMYLHPELREDYSKRAIELTKTLPSWDDIGDHFHDSLLSTIRKVEGAKAFDAAAEFDNE